MWHSWAHRTGSRTAPIDLESYEDDWDPIDDRGRRRGRSEAAQQRIDAVEDVARVVSTHRGEVEITFDGRILAATYGGSLRSDRVVVADEVRIDRPRDSSEPARMLAIDERRTTLVRADEDGGAGRLLVANMDLVFVVAAADQLGAGLRLLDRVVVAARAGGVQVGLVVNKSDMGDSGEVTAALTSIVGVDGPVVQTSATTGSGVDELRTRVSQGWTAFVGHSGVGKSTLFNALLPGVERRVGELGPHGGRHTTVRALAHPLGDGWVVDTPGIRSFGITAVAPEELAGLWPGLEALSCEVNGCAHVGEAGCAAPAALDARRLEQYRSVHAALLASLDK